MLTVTPSAPIPATPATHATCRRRERGGRGCKSEGGRSIGQLIMAAGLAGCHIERKEALTWSVLRGTPPDHYRTFARRESKLAEGLLSYETKPRLCRQQSVGQEKQGLTATAHEEKDTDFAQEGCGPPRKSGNKRKGCYSWNPIQR